MYVSDLFMFCHFYLFFCVQRSLKQLVNAENSQFSKMFEMGVTQDLPAVLRLRLLLQVEKKDNFMISYVNFFSLKCYNFLFQLQKGFCKLIG